jgi:IS1 family transposase
MLRCLEGEADAMASFVQKKANKQWIWIAMDARSRQVIAFHVGNHSRQSAKRLWAKIPEAYRQHATFYTDQYVVYAGVLAAAQRSTEPSGNWPGKSIISSGSTTPCGSGCRVSCARRYPSPRSWPMTWSHQVLHVSLQPHPGRSITWISLP